MRVSDAVLEDGVLMAAPAMRLAVGILPLQGVWRLDRMKCGHQGRALCPSLHRDVEFGLAAAIYGLGVSQDIVVISGDDESPSESNCTGKPAAVQRSKQSSSTSGLAVRRSSKPTSLTPGLAEERSRPSSSTSGLADLRSRPSSSSSGFATI